jgi:hypothetical protein
MIGTKTIGKENGMSAAPTKIEDSKWIAGIDKRLEVMSPLIASSRLAASGIVVWGTTTERPASERSLTSRAFWIKKWYRILIWNNSPYPRRSWKC